MVLAVSVRNLVMFDFSRLSVRCPSFPLIPLAPHFSLLHISLHIKLVFSLIFWLVF